MVRSTGATTHHSSGRSAYHPRFGLNRHRGHLVGVLEDLADRPALRHQCGADGIAEAGDLLDPDAVHDGLSSTSRGDDRPLEAEASCLAEPAVDARNGSKLTEQPDLADD